VTSGKVVTTLGYERRNNPALKFTDRAKFIRFMNADQPLRPANIANIVAINQGLRPLTMEPPRAPALTPAEFADLRAKDALVVDTRSSAEFGAGHVTAALSIHLASPEFEQRVGWITPADVPLLLVLERDELMPRAMEALAFLGLDWRVKGFLAGGMPAWRGEGRDWQALPQIDVRALHQRLQGPEAPQVLDVREASEWNEAHIDGSHLQSYRQLAGHLGELPIALDTPVAVVCRSGTRSSTAASVMQRHGFSRVFNVTGGMEAWKKAGLPAVTPGTCGVDPKASVPATQIG
jgi:hydroxyacylglutathione hydrolase